MRHKLYASLALSTAVAAACPARTVTTRPTAISEASTTDGTFWALNSAGTYAVAQRLADGTDRRGIMEFNLGAIPAGATITGATLGYSVGVFGTTAGGKPPVLQFRGYTGNGILEAADPTRPYAVIGTSPDINANARYTTAVDPAYIGSVVNGSSAWLTPFLGVMTYQQQQDAQAGIYKFVPETESPLLTVEYTIPDIWVSGTDFNVRRYTQAGVLAETLTVPFAPGDGRPPTDQFVRGTAVDRSGRLSVYNGTAKPYISTYDPAGGGTWTHRTDTGLSTNPSTSVWTGSVATFGSYLFASDMIPPGPGAVQINGVVRFSTADESVLRFGGTTNASGNADFLTRGQDGLLYVVSDGVTAGRIVLKVFNPYSGALLRTVGLPMVVNGLAVGPTGEIYATSGGFLYDLSPTGTIVKSLGIGNDAQGVDLWTDGSIVVGTRASGVHLTDTSLTSQTTIVPYTPNVPTAMVSFAVPAPERGWRNDTAGTSAPWWDPRNWNGPIPDAADGGADSIAVFGPAITGNRSVLQDSVRTLGTIVFDSPFSYRITNGGSASGVLTMDVPAGQRAMIDVVRGSHTLTTRVVLNDDLTIHTGVGATVAFPPTFGAVPGRLDITDHNVIWDYAAGGTSPAATIRVSLSAGRGSTGTWTGPGIISSVAAADPGKFTGIAYAEASDLGITTYAGQPVDASAVILQLAPYGDTNLDGTIDADDYARLDRGLAKALTGWINGDFNYDNAITAADYLLIDRSYAHQLGTLSPEFLAMREAEFGPEYVADLLAAVPEPGTASLLVIAAGWIARRRRSR